MEMYGKETTFISVNKTTLKKYMYEKNIYMY